MSTTDCCGEAAGSSAVGGQTFLGSGDVQDHVEEKVLWWSFKGAA